VHLKTGSQREAMRDKSLNRELRETGIWMGASPTSRMCHGHPGYLTLLKQNIFFPNIQGIYR